MILIVPSLQKVSLVGKAIVLHPLVWLLSLAWVETKAGEV